MIYLYVTPSGIVNLIEGEKMPIGERKTCGGKGFCCDWNTPCQSMEYDKHLQAAKASSVPVDDQERGRKLCFDALYETDGDRMTNRHIRTHDGVFYGPFDIEYEINYYVKDADNETGRTIISQELYQAMIDHPERGYEAKKVAILLPKLEPVGKLEEKETPEQFYARGRYPEMKDKFDKSAARFSYDDMMQFADNYIEALKKHPF